MDSTKNYNEDFKERWVAFKVIALDPWVLSLLFLIGIFYFLSGDDNSASMKLWLILIGLVGTVLGARIMKLIREYTEESVLVARGKSAVRSLKTLIKVIYSLEKRADIFLSRLKKGKANELTINNFEELKTGFNLLQEETINSIENWTDIVPGADIQSQVGVITDLKGQLEDKSTELNQLQSNIDEAEGKTEVDKEELNNQIKEKIKEIEKLKSEIWKKDFNLGVPLSTSPGGLGSFGGKGGRIFPPIDFPSSRSGVQQSLLSARLRERKKNPKSK